MKLHFMYLREVIITHQSFANTPHNMSAPLISAKKRLQLLEFENPSTMIYLLYISVKKGILSVNFIMTGNCIYLFL